MRLGLTYILLFLGFGTIPCLAQTASDLSSKYGGPIQSYEIRPGIFVTAKYDANGEVCEMTVEKRHVQGSGDFVLDETFLSAEERKWIVDELAPAAKRGQELKPTDNLITSRGVGVTERYEYENVSITYYSKNIPTTKNDTIVIGTACIVITWKNRLCKQG